MGRREFSRAMPRRPRHARARLVPLRRRPMMELRRTISMFAAAAAIAFFTTPVEGKCGFRLYRVEIEVRSQVTGAPIAGVRVTAFANGAESEMRILTSDLNDAISAVDGRLVRTYVFNTSSGGGLLFGDRCNARVRTLELIATHSSYQAKRILI